MSSPMLTRNDIGLMSSPMFSPNKAHRTTRIIPPTTTDVHLKPAVPNKAQGVWNPQFVWKPQFTRHIKRPLTPSRHETGKIEFPHVVAYEWDTNDVHRKPEVIESVPNSEQWNLKSTVLTSPSYTWCSYTWSHSSQPMHRRFVWNKKLTPHLNTPKWTWKWCFLSWRMPFNGGIGKMAKLRLLRLLAGGNWKKLAC